MTREERDQSRRGPIFQINRVITQHLKALDSNEWTRAQNSGRQVIIGDGIRIELIVQTDAARRATLEAIARSTTKTVTGPVPQRDLAAEIAAANAESQRTSGIPMVTQRQKFPRTEIRHPENAETRTPK